MNTNNNSNQNIKSLAGKTLVYIGQETDDIYNNSVIYITENTSSGSEGIIINKLLFATAALECKSPQSNNETELKNIYEELYQGGPENPAHGFVLFPKDEYKTNDPYAKINGEIAISTSFGILQEILDGLGPNKKIIAMGHCKWNSGELEWEIFNNKWLVIQTDLNLMFETKFDDKWEKAKNLSNIDMRSYMRQSGTA